MARSNPWRQLAPNLRRAVLARVLTTSEALAIQRHSRPGLVSPLPRHLWPAAQRLYLLEFRPQALAH